MTALALLALAAWAFLAVARDRFWMARDTDEAPAAAPAAWPPVTAIVPARDEAAVIAASLGSLLAQDYAGDLRVVLVDDGSGDDTAGIARSLRDPRLTVIAGTAPPPGWTGKLWAMETGCRAAGRDPRWLWFTDADIAHAPDTLRSLVARGEQDGLALNSLMAVLETTAPAERALIPAFVLFFQMLYPFARVNRPGRTAAAAGGCMLVRRDALAAAGGLAAIASALIDDCALGAAMKREGPIRLSLTRRSASIRPYGGWRRVGAMIARSAYAQLRYSPVRLAGTIAGLLLLFAVPVAASFAGGTASVAGLLGWGLMAFLFQPMLRFYGRSPLWGAALPGIGLFYGGCTLLSAAHYYQGRGGTWKGRAQAGLEAVR